MRAVIQRTKQASVKINNSVVAQIEKGLLVLIGLATGDEQKFDYMAERIINLRIFEDENNKMNLSVKDTGGGIIIVPNFTLYGDARQGRRPSFISGAKSEEAAILFEKFCKRFIELYPEGKTGVGVFQADMLVSIENDGPVTILLDSEKLF